MDIVFLSQLFAISMLNIAFTPVELFLKSKKKVKELFSKGREADWLIYKIVKTSENPRRIIVVTDDRGIALKVRSTGSDILNTKDFINMLLKKKTSPVKNTEPEKSYNQDSVTEELKKLWLRRKW